MAKKERIDRNGYIAVHVGPDLATASVEDFKSEHIIIAEEILDRPLKAGEEVHHLDANRKNNSPDNLLILTGPMHAKLEMWLSRNVIIPKPEYAKRKALGCIRCKYCEKPISPGMVYCSPEHAAIGKQKVERPDKETLERLVENTPMTKIGEMFGVSDNAVKKWCKSLEIELGDRRGHWTKKVFEKI